MQTANPHRAPAAKVADAPSIDVGRINVLSIKGHIGRVRYIGYTVGVMLLLNFGGGLVAALAGPTIGAAIFLTAIIAVIVLSTMVMVQRAHDFNAAGWRSSNLFLL